MSTIISIAVWTVIVGTVAFLYIREKRSGRKGIGDFDRTKHEAVQQSSMDAQTRGPTATPGMFGG